MKKERIIPKNKHGNLCPEAQAIKAGNHILVGGLMSLDGQGRVIGSDIMTQAKSIFESLKSVLAEAGASMADVVKHNVYYHCDGDRQAEKSLIDDLNRVRLDYFSEPGPTTTEIRVGLDREGARLLVDAWAIIGAEKQRLLPAGHWTWDQPLPFSQGWKVGDMIFVGGQRSLDRKGQVVGIGDIEIQTDHAFRNLDTMLKAGGGGQSNLMRQNTYYRFLGQGPEVTNFWEKMTRVRMRYMSTPSPAGAGLRVAGFPYAEELIQVEGIGVLGERRQRLQPANHWDWSISGNQFTQGWRIGDLAFIGGQISADNQAKAVGNDMAAQTRHVFRFIRSVLGEAGLDERDVAKLFIYYYAPEDWKKIADARETIAEVQREFYPEPGPVTTAVRVSGFAFEDLLIEIEALAFCRD